MNYLILFVKGFIIGIAKIIPGVSGAVIAITLGVYERIIKIISHPFKVNNIKYLIPLGLGIGFSIFLLSNVIKWFLLYYPLPTISLFSGLIIGELPDIAKEIKYNKTNIIIFLITLLFSFYLMNIHNFNINKNNLTYLLMGIIEALTTIIPGVSGTAIFMSLNLYTNLLEVFNEIVLMNINYEIILFILGFIITIFISSKIINYLFEKHKSKAYSSILGLSIISLITMIKSVHFNKSQMIVGILFFYFGYKCIKKINNFLNNKSYH